MRRAWLKLPRWLGGRKPQPERLKKHWLKALQDRYPEAGIAVNAETGNVTVTGSNPTQVLEARRHIINGRDSGLTMEGWS